MTQKIVKLTLLWNYPYVLKTLSLKTNKQIKLLGEPMCFSLFLLVSFPSLWQNTREYQLSKRKRFS